jgi:DNA-binding MarR family transcriptional regulator
MPGDTTPGAPLGGRDASGSTAFLLAQVGAHASARFAQRIAELDLTPAQAGLLREIAREPGRSQQQLATHLGVPPSRFVTLVDTLEARDLVERRRSTADRRAYGLHLTGGGQAMMRDLGKLAQAHDADICAGLDNTQRRVLRQALTHIAARHGLIPGVYPGYQRLDEREESASRDGEAGAGGYRGH